MGQLGLGNELAQVATSMTSQNVLEEESTEDFAASFVTPKKKKTRSAATPGSKKKEVIEFLFL